MKWLDRSTLFTSIPLTPEQLTTQAANWQPGAHEIERKCTWEAAQWTTTCSAETVSWGGSQVVEIVSRKDSPMYDPVDFIGGIFLGIFLGSLAMLIYHVRQIRQESRQNYVRLSLAQAEVVTLERTLEIHRRGSPPDSRQPIQNPAVPENEPTNEIPLMPPWIGKCEASSPSGIASERPQSRAGET